MANRKPVFITGANAKIKVDGKTMAYAQDVSYSVSVDTIPIETMGRYEAVTIEPVNYSVAGEFSIVRYTAAGVTAGALTGGNVIDKSAANGNGVGQIGIDDNVNPGNLLDSLSWDLEVFQKGVGTGGSTANDKNSLIIKILDCRVTRKSGGLNKRGILVERISFVGLLHSDDSVTVSRSGDTDLATS